MVEEGSLVYLDHHATTPVDPRVLDQMLPFLRESFGNPSSSHSFGTLAASGVHQARRQVAEALGCSPGEVYFTSGATESNNLAIVGTLKAFEGLRNQVITCVTEHSSVLEVTAYLETEGARVVRLPVNRRGVVDVSRLQEEVTNETAIVSLMWANGEIGTVHPIKELAAIAHSKGAIFHTDATQAFSTIPIDVTQADVDLLSISAHKAYGPKGVGAIFVSRNLGVHLQPLMRGGGQEKGLRSGTLNVPGCVGFGAAAEIVGQERDSDAGRISQLRSRLEARLKAEIPDIFVNGDLDCRLPGNLNVTIPGIDAEAVIASLPDVAISSGSACSSFALHPSSVLLAIGLSQDEAYGSLRMGIGRFSTEGEIDYAASRLSSVIRSVGQRLDDPRREVVRHG